MAYVTPGTVAAGDVATAAAWNVLVGNDISLRALANVQSVILTTPVTIQATTVAYTYYDFTGLSVSITPTSDTSKILVTCNVFAATPANTNTFYRLVRDSTAIGVGTGSLGSRTAVTAENQQQVADTNSVGSLSFSVYDSPATTSATTYKIQIAQNGGTGAIYGNRTWADVNAGYTGRGASSIIVQEIPA